MFNLNLLMTVYYHQVVGHVLPNLLIGLKMILKLGVQSDKNVQKLVDKSNSQELGRSFPCPSESIGTSSLEYYTV